MSGHQTKLVSFIEAVVNNSIGMAIAFVAQDFLFGQVGIVASPFQNAGVVLGMTVVSILRSYIVRRVFDREIWK